MAFSNFPRNLADNELMTNPIQMHAKDIVFNFAGDERVIINITDDGKLDITVIGDMTNNAKRFIAEVKRLSGRGV